jgi:hypothetical protein
MANEQPVNDNTNEAKTDAVQASSKQKTAKTKDLPASKVFDLKVVPSEGADESDRAHSFCHTSSHSYCT